MYYITVSMLPVGQGAMNLIEVYEREGFSSRLAALTMIDCGFWYTRPKKNATLDKCTLASVKYAATRMRQRFEMGDGLFLDNLIFTHRDTDHWILFDNLWEELFGSNYSLKERSGQGLTGDKWITYDESSYDNYYMCESSMTYEYQRYFKHPYVLLGPNYEISGKITYRSGAIKSKLCYMQNYSNNIVEASWGTAGLTMKAYISQKGENLLDAKLVGNESGAVIHGLFMGKEYSWEWPAYPKSDSDFRQLIANFATEVLGQIQEFCHIGEIVDFLGKVFEFKSTEEIAAAVNEGQEICNVIGCVYVGGYREADRTKGGALSGVGKMLQRAHIASRRGVNELARDMEIKIGDSIELLILERLSADQLTEIDVVKGMGNKDLGIIKNGTSAVSVLLNTEDEEFQKFFFPGDATVHTFYNMIPDNRYELFSNAVWTAPHHGSKRTIFGEAEDGEVQMIFPWLLENTTPRAMVISAGLFNNHGHPNFMFMKWTADYFKAVKRRFEKHGIVINLNDDSKGEWRYTDTRFPMYTTVVTEDGQTIKYLNHRFSMSEPFHSYTYSNIRQSEFKYVFGIQRYSDSERGEHGPLSAAHGFLHKEAIPPASLFLHGDRAAF